MDGSLIFNSDAILYRSYGSETLIGYALDGFPIYGPTSAEKDACGGYDAPTGYRYAISADTNTVLECFMGTPDNFEAFTHGNTGL